MPKRTKVLVLSSRGVNHQDRHLMIDMRSIIPHSKKDCKFDKKDNLIALNEVAGLATCDKCLYFENRKGKVLFLWASNINGGPSAKFLVSGVHTMADIKLLGNSLKGSRPILSFDQHFEKIPHLSIIKELFVQIFNVPYKHPKSQPFVDRVITFSYLDGHIWFRHYQIIDRATMAEIGPRMILMPMLILSSSFHGKPLWANYRREPETAKKSEKSKYPNARKAEADSDSDSDVSMDDLEKYV